MVVPSFPGVEEPTLKLPEFQRLRTSSSNLEPSSAPTTQNFEVSSPTPSLRIKMAPSVIEHDAELCRQGVNQLLSKFKTIETNLRECGHHTNFSEDGICYMRGNADTNEGGLRSIAAWIHFFERRIRDETAPKVKVAHQDKPPAHVLPRTQTITPPPEWSKDNISRHATDDHVPNSTPAAPLCHQLQDEPRVNGGNSPQLLLQQQQQARIVELEEDLRDVEENQRAREEHAQHLRLQEQARTMHWKQQLLLADEARHDRLQRQQQARIEELEGKLRVSEKAEEQSEQLQEQQQARIVELEEKLSTSEEGKLAAEEQVQRLRQEKSKYGSDTRAGPNTQELADQILHLLTLHRAIVCKQDEHTHSIRQLSSGLYKLSLTQNDSTRRAQEDIARLTNSSFLGGEEMAQIKQMVNMPDSVHLRNLTEKVNIIETNISPLVAWAQSWHTG